MNRVLFRGQVRNTDYWVYGSIIYTSNSVYIISGADVVTKKTNGRWHINNSCFLIEEKTAGQYTTIDDKNGKQLFKDDIVRIPASMHNVEITGIIVWDKGRFLIKSISSGTAWDIGYSKDIEKLGNIHDNPEMINR